MDTDDLQRGTLLSRRDALKLLGVTSISLLAGCIPGLSGASQDTSPTLHPISPTSLGALPACIVRPELTEGPYFVDEELNRSDIRSDPGTGAVSLGTPLTLTFRVSQVANAACTPLPGAKVDVWHCDAAGVYSDVSDPGFNTSGRKFLRGYQLTDAAGNASFQTIYPGWYSGRTVHIHFKIHHDAGGQGRAFTSQLFFDDSLSDQVFAKPPYASRGPRNTLNSTDGIFNDQLILNAAPAKGGYAAAFNIGLDLG